MGSIGAGEIILIFLIALLLFGPSKLPELGRALGRAVREFKKAETEVRDAISAEPDLPGSEVKSENQPRPASETSSSAKTDG